ncbi:MAG: hypothetical protein AAF913_18165, partial [Pseudomonadota bacterium]
LSRDGERARRAKIRKDRHGVPSMTLSGCHVDTRASETAVGLLRRFQNTGTESSWHLAIPSMQYLGRSTRARRSDQA